MDDINLKSSNIEFNKSIYLVKLYESGNFFTMLLVVRNERKELTLYGYKSEPDFTFNKYLEMTLPSEDIDYPLKIEFSKKLAPDFYYSINKSLYFFGQNQVYTYSCYLYEPNEISVRNFYVREDDWLYIIDNEGCLTLVQIDLGKEMTKYVFRENLPELSSFIFIDNIMIIGLRKSSHELKFIQTE